MCYVQTQDFYFLYLKEKEFGKGRVWKDVQITLSEVNALRREPRVEHTCLKSQMWVSVPYGMTPSGTVRSSVF